MKASVHYRIILIFAIIALGTPSFAQEANNTRYVKVDSGSPDALVLDGTDFFESNALCKLKLNDKVTLLNETDGEYVKIKLKCNGKTIEGWVKGLILSKNQFNPIPRVTESAGGENSPQAARGTVGYEPIDTTEMRKKPIRLPWSDIDLGINFPSFFLFSSVDYNAPDMGKFVSDQLSPIWGSLGNGSRSYAPLVFSDKARTPVAPPWNGINLLINASPSDSFVDYSPPDISKFMVFPLSPPWNGMDTQYPDNITSRVVDYSPLMIGSSSSTPIAQPWASTDVTSENFKVFSSKKPTKGRNFILPIAAILAGGAAILIFQDDAESNPEIVISNDSFKVHCSDSLALNVLINDTGEGLNVTDVSATGADAILVNNQIIVSNFQNEMVVIQYQVTDSKGNTANGEVNLTVTFPILDAVDDTYETFSNTDLNGNLISNDTGQNLEIDNYTLPSTGTLVIGDEGDFTYAPEGGFEGNASFQYTVRDPCGQMDSATVSISVIQKCDFTTSNLITPADCGLQNGAASILVAPTGNYTFIWFDGLDDDTHGNLSEGDYSVIVTDENGCSVSTDVQITETTADYDLIVVTEDATCAGGGEIILSFINPGLGPLIVELGSPEGSLNFEVEDSGPIVLSDYMNVLAGEYTFNVFDEGAGSDCSNTISAIVNDNSELPVANDDTISTLLDTPISENVITNDTGVNIMLESVQNEQNGTVTFSENGDFTFVPSPGFVGTATFEYTILDACGQNTSATVFIEVLDDGCAFTVDFTITPANCGFDDGSISTSVVPSGNYQFVWSDGTTDFDLLNAFATNYTLIVTDLIQGCSLDFSVEVPENEPAYISDLSTSPASCEEQGTIQFNIQSPDGGGFELLIEHDGAETTQLVPDGFVNIGDHITVTEGNYFISACAVNAGEFTSESNRTLDECCDFVIVSLLNTASVSVQVTSQINPSGPAASDGAITGFVSSSIPPPYDVFINDVPTTFPGADFDFQNLTEGLYTIYAENADGCQSPPVSVALTTGSNVSSKFAFIWEIKAENNASAEPHTNDVSYNPAFRLEYDFCYKIIESKVGAVVTINSHDGGPINTYEFYSLFGRSWNVHNLHVDLMTGPFVRYLDRDAEFQIQSNGLRNGLLFQPNFQIAILDKGSQFPINILFRMGARYYTNFSDGNLSWYTGLVFE